MLTFGCVLGLDCGNNGFFMMVMLVLQTSGVPAIDVERWSDAPSPYLLSAV